MLQSFALPRGMRTFIVIWVGQLVSLIGSGLTAFALGVYIYEQTGSATSFALNMLAYFVPRILFSPIAGVIADRYDRRFVMIVSDVLGGVSTISVLVLFSWFHLPWWFIYIATATNATANTFQWPAYAAATTMLVPKEHLGRASGMTQAANAISELLAPGIAGVLYVVIGPHLIFSLDLATFVVSIVMLAFVRIPHPDQTTEEHHLTGLAAFWHEVSFGLRYLRKRPGLRNLLIVFAVCNFLFMLAHPLIPPMILSQTSPEVLGLFGSIAGVGMMTGTIVMSVWGGPKRKIFGVAAFDMLGGLFNLLLGFARSLPPLTAGAFGLMFTLPITNGCNQALWQSKVAPDVQGRVFSVRTMISFSAMPLGMLLSGPLADYVFTPALMPGGTLVDTWVGQLLGVGPGRGIGLMLILTSILYIIASSISLIHPRIRRVEIELPDAQVVTEKASTEEVSVLSHSYQEEKKTS
ncbi:MAG: MFS transporter [Anaerolineae bacterium]|nr:MFS transporter [Anaerolineae bacterium]